MISPARLIVPILVMAALAAPPLSGKDGMSARDQNEAGLSYLERGMAREAEESFLSAAALAPGEKHYLNNLAAACMRQGKYTEARVHLLKCIALDKNYARALSNLAVVSFRLSLYRESYGYYLRALQADREYAALRFDKERVTRELKKIAEQEPAKREIGTILKLVETHHGTPDGAPREKKSP